MQPNTTHEKFLRLSAWRHRRKLRIEKLEDQQPPSSFFPWVPLGVGLADLSLEGASLQGAQTQYESGAPDPSGPSNLRRPANSPSRSSDS